MAASHCSVTPTQIGAILDPTRLDLIKLHNEFEHVTPTDDMFKELPSKLLQGREWNLPGKLGYLIYTALHPSKTGKTSQKVINGTKAFWKFQTDSKHAVGDDLGQPIGLETTFNLYFKGEGRAETKGIWKATEYRSLNNNKNKSAMVILNCMDEKLVAQEQLLRETEDEVIRLRQVLSKFENAGMPDEAGKTRKQVDAVVLKLNKLKLELEEAKAVARRTEEMNAGIQN